MNFQSSMSLTGSYDEFQTRIVEIGQNVDS